MNIFTRAWTAVKSFVTSHPTAEMVVVELTTFEHSLLQKFHPLFNQIATTLGTQGIQIVEDALTGAMTTAATGNIAAGITAAATQALGQIETDAKADAKNAVYGLLAATVATLPAQAPVASPA